MSTTLHEIQRFLFSQARKFPNRPQRDLLRLVTDWSVLESAWRKVRPKTRQSKERGGTGGGSHKRSGPTGDQREMLLQLAADLQAGCYEPQPVRRFKLPKASNPEKFREVAQLAVPDRVVHMALKLVLDPLVEARLGKQCFGFRAGRTRFDQLQAVCRLVQNNPEAYSGALASDIASCFDKLDHRLLQEDFQSVVADSGLHAVFHNILLHVGQGVKGFFRRRPVGVLQGSPLSPLLANWNLSRFDRAWQRMHRDEFPIFRYADDLVVLTKDVDMAQRLQKSLRRCLQQTARLDLQFEKTMAFSLDAGVPLLGLVVRRHWDTFQNQKRCRVFVDPDGVREVLQDIQQWAVGLSADLPLGQQFAVMNQRLRGWFEAWQFSYDAPHAFQAVDEHLFRTLRPRLKELLGTSNANVQRECLFRLPSGHQTWSADGVQVLVLSSLPRRLYRPKVVRAPWEKLATQTATGPFVPNLFSDVGAECPSLAEYGNGPVPADLGDFVLPSTAETAAAETAKADPVPQSPAGRRRARRQADVSHHLGTDSTPTHSPSAHKAQQASLNQSPEEADHGEEATEEGEEQLGTKATQAML